MFGDAMPPIAAAAAARRGCYVTAFCILSEYCSELSPFRRQSSERSTPVHAVCIDQKSQLFRPLINNDNYRNEAGVNGLVLNLLRRDLVVRRDLAVINESM